MGYTHYWVLVDGFYPAALEAAVKDMSEIVYRSELPVAGPNGQPGTDPEIGQTRIALNGIGDESNETFLIDADRPGWDFCKTARKPYDSVVAACLLAAKHHLPDHFQLSSDGSWDDEWTNGASDGCPPPVALYERIFPDRAPLIDQLGIDRAVEDQGFKIRMERWQS